VAALVRMVAGLALMVGTTHGRPAETSLSLAFPAASVVTTSPVVWKGGRAWLAVLVDDDLRIYHWQQRSWLLDGNVKLPPGFPGPQPSGGELSSTSLTGGTAPDFTAHFTGADTLWFAFAARLEGRWRIVPFDDQFGHRDPYTFAYGATQGRIQGIFDWCGCAQGPTTFQWYRFARTVFVPTAPPGPSPACSVTALSSASHWPTIADDPLVRHVARPFRYVRFACDVGWALATDGREVAVYEQRSVHWLRVGVGTPRLLSTRTEFALPRSVLDRLATRIGVHFPPMPPKPGIRASRPSRSGSEHLSPPTSDRATPSCRSPISSIEDRGCSR
jgi:hypothetical protein